VIVGNFYLENLDVPKVFYSIQLDLKIRGPSTGAIVDINIDREWPEYYQ